MQTRFIRPNDMESIAESVLAKANIPYVWQGKIERTDIDSIIEFEYGLDIVWENIDHLAHDEDVLAAIFPTQKLICMNETKKNLFEEKVGLMNFSKAHELGHWILHVTDEQDYDQLTFNECDTYFCRFSLNKLPQEIQANMFAASILMPRDIVCNAVNQLKLSGEVKFGDLYRLKDAFEVTISAMVARVQELKLLYVKDKKVYLSKDHAMGQLSLLGE